MRIVGKAEGGVAGGAHGDGRGSPRPGARARVLAVDDDEANLRVLRAQLDPGVYALTTLTDPLEALRVLARGDAFDALLLDIAMPHVSGLALARTVRLLYPVPLLPILFLSGSADADAIRDAFAAGGNDFLAKPVRGGELMARLEFHLAVARAFEGIFAARRPARTAEE
jgi:CheY-like chemotaxis protein